MSTDFDQLNHGWNAEPNAPAEQLSVLGECVTLEFYVNAFIFHDVTEEDRVRTLSGVLCPPIRAVWTSANCWAAFDDETVISRSWQTGDTLARS